MKKLLFLGSGTVLVLVIAGLVIFYLQLGRIVKAGIETAAPRVTQCPVTVGDIDIRPLRGKLLIQKLVLGNPAGFKTDSAFSVQEIRVELNPKSLFSQEIHVQEIFIDAPEITYEVGVGKTNIGTIQKNIQAFIDSVGGGGAEKPEAKSDTGPGKKVVIDHVLVQGGRIRLSGPVVPASIQSPVLPSLELHDIGKGDPVSMAEAMARILNEVFHGVIAEVKKTGHIFTDAAKDIGNTAKETGSSVKKSVGGVLKSVKGIFGKKEGE